MMINSKKYSLIEGFFLLLEFRVNKYLNHMQRRRLTCMRFPFTTIYILIFHENDMVDRLY
jgi:hypothetical protein